MRTAHFTMICGSLVLISCHKDVIFNSSLTSNPTSYELASIVWSGPTTNGESFYFTYNSAHLLTDCERIQWGDGGYNITDSGNIPLPGWADTGYYHLSYANGRTVRLDMVNDPVGANGYFTYSYNDKGWLTTVATYAHNGQSEDITYDYSYNSKSQVTDMFEYGSSPTPAYHDTYSYDSNGNLANEVDSILYTSPVWVLITDYTSYDHGVNVAKALNGYPLCTATTNNFGFSSSISPNNVAASSNYGSIQPGDPWGLLSVDSMIYQYNDAGLPVQQLAGPWIITYTYNKY